MRALVQKRREWLAEVWVDMGCSHADAVARACAWSPSLSDEAVIQQLRKGGSKAAIPAIKSATASFNDRLADHLMLAFGHVHTEEQRAAEAAAATSSVIRLRRQADRRHFARACRVNLADRRDASALGAVETDRGRPRDCEAVLREFGRRQLSCRAWQVRPSCQRERQVDGFPVAAIEGSLARSPQSQ